VIKIMREDLDKGELLLYFLERGDTCSMTLNCCLGDKKSEIRAIGETDGTVAMIPISKMEEWMGKYRSWRAFVMESYNIRFNEMLSAIDHIAFMKMDERLYNYLLDKKKITGSSIISQTHQEIASNLNSSRVVISRLLKFLENEGLVKLNRNSIELLSAYHHTSQRTATEVTFSHYLIKYLCYISYNMITPEVFGYILSTLVGVSLGIDGSGGSILSVPSLVYGMGIEPIIAT